MHVTGVKRETQYYPLYNYDFYEELWSEPVIMMRQPGAR